MKQTVFFKIYSEKFYELISSILLGCSNVKYLGWLLRNSGSINYHNNWYLDLNPFSKLECSLRTGILRSAFFYDSLKNKGVQPKFVSGNVPKFRNTKIGFFIHLTPLRNAKPNKCLAQCTVLSLMSDNPPPPS